MKVVTIMCDACRMPLSPGETGLPAERPAKTMQEALVLQMGIALPPDALSVAGGHLHAHCRTELDAALEAARRTIAERAARDTALLRAAFEGGDPS